jgi:hypothetical protein
MKRPGSSGADTDPWDLLFAHRYEDALARANAAKVDADHPSPVLLARAAALLCLGRFRGALAVYEAGSELLRQDQFKVPPFLDELGTTLWLLGNKVVAKEIWRASVDGIRYNTIHYADAAGGVEQGLLLWYGGVSTCDPNATEHALAYLEWLSKKKLRISNWPGSLALFALDKKSFDNVLKELECEDLKAAFQRSRGDVKLKRDLVQALLCLGTRLRADGDSKGSRHAFRRCAELENPVTELAWYLAAAEVGQLRKTDE